jgi:thiamine biosynthesis lipoprotein
MTTAPTRVVCEAMRTQFTLHLDQVDAATAGSIRSAAQRELDRLEALLSRFRSDSDVCRIAAARAGETVRVGWETVAVLRRARDIHAATAGAFDPTVGAWMDGWRAADRQWERVDDGAWQRARAAQGIDRLVLDAPAAVGIRADAATPVAIDLGAIGKGFALDQLAELLTDDWGVPAFLLDSGGSTVLARGPRTWRVGIGGAWGARDGMDVIGLRDAALSGSGGEVQGAHIVDPRAGGPARAHLAAWAVAPDAAGADALSTAFLVLDTDAIDRCCAALSGVHGLTVPPDGGRCRATAGLPPLLITDEVIA